MELAGWYYAILVKNPIRRRKGGKNSDVNTTNRTYSWSFVTHIFRNGFMVTTLKLSK